MSEVSNKVLAVLVALAIIVSIGGTLMLLTKIKPTMTGAATGVAKVDVTAVVAISLPTSTVDFGTIYQGATDNTTDNSPGPLIIQNDGGVDVNVSIARDSNSSALFSGTGGGDNTVSFRFKIDNSTESNSFNYAASTTTWTNVPGVAGINNMLNELKYNDATDTAEVDLLIDVPNDEPIGSKNETLVFTATQS
ncbi:hypothetical protein GOV06_05280 [Candidatus Woesearchaeota archaeon]|nr:hypothetical protein [Candidatus Woesearchaeota archaeon]